MSKYDSQFLKWRMEQVWIQRGCVSPNHLANWSDYERGFRVYSKDHSMILLWFKRGKRMTSQRGCKPKGKGFSFLPKFYQLAWKAKEEKKIAADNCTCALPHARPWWWCKTHGEVTVFMD